MSDFMLKNFSSSELARLKESVDKEIEKRRSSWDKYIAYLREWADDNADPAYMGQSPVCFDEFCDNHIDEEA